jgi:amidohydrolase
MKEHLYQTIERHAEAFRETSLYIGRNPELGHEEFKAFDKLTKLLESFGFEVERGVLDISTAFIARYRSGKEGPVIAFLAEYDALPDIGHACGHHLICSMSIAAAVALQSVIEETGGEIRVYGTPAEETKGAKVPMSAAGLFDDADIALMAHPYHTYERSGQSLAMDALQFEYHGKPAHAAANPSEGINALDAVLMLFNSINALRQQLESHVRIHGIITEGGKAANIIPEYAVAQFYVRSSSRLHTDLVVKKVLDCAQGAALQTGCRLTVSNYEYSYDELSTNETLSSVFSENLKALGISEDDIETGKDHGSLDLGNVSRKVPSIHPYVKVVDEKHLLHTTEFRDLAMTGRALDGMLFGAKVLAATAYDVLTVPGLLTRIREEFEQTVRK